MGVQRSFFQGALGEFF